MGPGYPNGCARLAGASTYHLCSSGQQVQGASVEIFARTSLFLPLHGVDYTWGYASPCPVYCVSSGFWQQMRELSKFWSLCVLS